MEPERVLGCDLALRNHLLEEPLTAFERLSEALLLAANELLDFLPAFLELGIRIAHVLTDDRRKLPEEWLDEAQPPTELRGPSDHPP